MATACKRKRSLYDAAFKLRIIESAENSNNYANLPVYRGLLFVFTTLTCRKTKCTILPVILPTTRTTRTSMILGNIWTRFLGGDLYMGATYRRVYTVVPLVPCRTVGIGFHHHTQSTVVSSTSLSWFLLPGLFWPASFSPHTISCCPGHFNSIWRMCPTNWNLLSLTVSCIRLCSVRVNTSVLVTLSFHVTPRIFHKYRWWNTFIFFSISWSCFSMCCWHIWLLTWLLLHIISACYSDQDNCTSVHCYVFYLDSCHFC